MCKGPWHMNNSDIQKQIVGLVVQQVQLDVEHLDTHKSLHDYGFDEFDMIEYVMKCEDTFGVIIEDSDVSTLQSIDDTVQYIAAKKL